MVFILYIIALVLLILASVGAQSSRFNLGWAGMAFWIVAEHIVGITF